MPNLDKTGPRGEGPRTGRGMGDCSGAGGTGRGFGRFCSGCPFCGNQTVNKEDRKQILEEEKKLIEEELKDLS